MQYSEHLNVNDKPPLATFSGKDSLESILYLACKLSPIQKVMKNEI